MFRIRLVVEFSREFNGKISPYDCQEQGYCSNSLENSETTLRLKMCKSQVSDLRAALLKVTRPSYDG